VSAEPDHERRAAPRRLRNLLGLLTRPKPVVGATPADAVYSENKWRLLRYRPRPASEGGLAYRTPVLLVPSLINRHYVLDLQPGRSFAAWLVARGHDVFIVDWGTPTDEDRYLASTTSPTATSPAPCASRPRTARAARPTCSGTASAARSRPFTPRRTPGASRRSRPSPRRWDSATTGCSPCGPTRPALTCGPCATRRASCPGRSCRGRFTSCARRSRCRRPRTCSTARGTTSSSTASSRSRPGAATT
jgi:hypothetical protein